MSKESREEANARRRAELEAKKAANKAKHEEKMSQIKAKASANNEKFKTEQARLKDERREIIGNMAKAVKEFNTEISDTKADLKDVTSEAKRELKEGLVEGKAIFKEGLEEGKQGLSEAMRELKEGLVEGKAIFKEGLVEGKAIFKDGMVETRKNFKEGMAEAGQILRGEVAPPPKMLSEKKQAELEEKLRDPKFAAKYEAKQAKEAAAQAGMEMHAQMKTELKAKTGKVVFKQHLGLKRLTIFENGYVQVGLMGTPEKLLSVDGDINIVRKGAFGRTAGGLAGTLVGLGPVNMLSPSNRGDLSLTIVTDVGAHSFHTDVPTKDSIKTFREAEVRCKALLKSLEGSSNNSAKEPTASKLGLSEELEKISKLKEQGLLSEEEFAAAKAKLISG